MKQQKTKTLLRSKVQGHKVVNIPVTFNCLTQEICILNVNTGVDGKLQARKKHGLHTDVNIDRRANRCRQTERQTETQKMCAQSLKPVGDGEQNKCTPRS